MNLRIESAAIDSLMVRLFDQIDEANMPWLIAAAEQLREAFGAQLIDLVPSYTTLLLHYDLHALSEAEAIALINSSLHNLQPLANETGTLHAIPVWYNQSVGPELTSIAQRAGLSPEQVIEQHCSRDYPVFTLGFAPGFAYMGLVDEALASARLATPRQRVPKGSVGIAERQTAIYPLTSPGGWNLIGRCPLTLFSAERGSLLQPGDRVRFVSIDHAEFIRLGGDDTAMEVSA
ncbi:5-oxoprolinase subunit PxpB [Halopseudomonas oceani]|uniref:5-oxoprolinase subunit PxpB n=1 Tax=Halopseudomonas oceani TaxID=1708783 RepID=UPI002AA8EA80|nr:5-oxoprolinase subunit PxpB [Halopseudomonas oceani]